MIHQSSINDYWKRGEAQLKSLPWQSHMYRASQRHATGSHRHQTIKEKHQMVIISDNNSNRVLSTTFFFLVKSILTKEISENKQR